ncbi:MAG TPA: hypothetical protein QF873_00315 [Patescibacteria group bacterium]|nr:hypothetical protein [Patescibacteria group bacterium]
MFDKQKQEELLGAIYESLGKGGTFLTFAYLQGRALPTGKKFQKLLNETFSKVEVSDPVWKNIPPAIVYKCTK